MLTLENGLYLRVQELPDGPAPRPLGSGFSTAVAYFSFSNDRDEIWFICNRHVRLVGVLADQSAARLPLAFAPARVAAGVALKQAGGHLPNGSDAIKKTRQPCTAHTA